jgi:hypothetical protein
MNVGWESYGNIGWESEIGLLDGNRSWEYWMGILHGNIRREILDEKY